MSDPTILTTGPAELTRDTIREAIGLLDRDATRAFEEKMHVRRVIVGSMARRMPLDLRGPLSLAAAHFGVDADVVNLAPLPPAQVYVGPWIEVPPPTVREGRARDWKRQTRADRKKMRQRRRGDRAGRPL